VHGHHETGRTTREIERLGVELDVIQALQYATCELLLHAQRIAVVLIVVGVRADLFIAGALIDADPGGIRHPIGFFVRGPEYKMWNLFETNLHFPATDKIYAVSLRDDVGSPVKPESDMPSAM